MASSDALPKDYDVISSVFNVRDGTCHVDNLLAFSPLDHFPCKGSPTYSVTVLDLICENYEDFYNRIAISVESPSLINQIATNREHISHAKTLICGHVNGHSGKVDFAPNTLDLTKLDADLKFNIMCWRKQPNGEIVKHHALNFQGLMFLKFVRL